MTCRVRFANAIRRAPSIFDTTSANPRSSVRWREFSSSATYQFLNPHNIADVPPESPKFIPIPRSAQPYQIIKQPVKGVLPYPRNVLRPSRRQKPIPEVISDLERLDAVRIKRRHESLSVQRIGPAIRPLVEHKTKKSALRRRNLIEGLREIEERQRRKQFSMAMRSGRRQAEISEIRNAPKPEDEVLTQPTVMQKDQVIGRYILPDPDRETRIANSRKNAQRTQAHHDTIRQQQLHDLYINAKDFIVDGQALKETVDRAFDQTNKDLFATDQYIGENIWVHGSPDTAAELLDAAQGEKSESSGAYSSKSHKAEIHEERLDDLGDALLGGKHR